MSDRELRAELIRVAAELPKGDPIRKEILAALTRTGKMTFEQSVEAHKKDPKWLLDMAKAADDIHGLLKTMRKPLADFYNRLSTLQQYEPELLTRTPMNAIPGLLERSHVDSLSGILGVDAFFDIHMAVKDAQRMIDKGAPRWEKYEPRPR